MLQKPFCREKSLIHKSFLSRTRCFLSFCVQLHANVPVIRIQSNPNPYPNTHKQKCACMQTCANPNRAARCVSHNRKYKTVRRRYGTRTVLPLFFSCLLAGESLSAALPYFGSGVVGRSKPCIKPSFSSEQTSPPMTMPSYTSIFSRITSCLPS